MNTLNHTMGPSTVPNYNSDDFPSRTQEHLPAVSESVSFSAQVPEVDPDNVGLNPAKETQGLM